MDIARTHMRPSPSTYLPSGPPPPPPAAAAQPMHSPTAIGAAEHHFHNDHCVMAASAAAAAAAEALPSKNCCGVHVTQTVSIRWFIVMIAFVGICCSIVGTALGALKASGREHLTVSLLMIGVGIVLITVSGIAWRLTSSDSPSCAAMLGFGGSGGGVCGLMGGLGDEDYANGGGGRFLTRQGGASAAAGGGGGSGGGGGGANGGNVNGHCGANRSANAQHPYAAMMYSDFHYRPPPPSYQASMQEYRLRLLLLDRTGSTGGGGGGGSGTGGGGGGVGGPSLSAPHASAIASPPPQYRPNLRTAITNAVIHSRPPSYRSHSSDQETSAPATQRNSTDAAAVHSTDRVITHQPTAQPATAADLSSLRPDLVNVVSVNPPPSSVAVPSASDAVADPGSSAKSTPMKTAVMMTADDLLPPPLKSSGGSSKKDSVSGRKNNKKNARHNLVTIVQTSRTDPVENGTLASSSSSAGEESVIVTVSGSVDSQQSLRASPGEVQILAHL